MMNDFFSGSNDKPIDKQIAQWTWQWMKIDGRH